ALGDVARQRGVSPEEAVIDLVVEDGSRVAVAYFLMSEENVRREVALPWVSFDSDADAPAPEGVFLKSSRHPRTYGNFARVLAKYVREERVLTLQEAIRKLAALPAATLSLADRGRLKAGDFADVVVFDPQTIQDHATYERPQQLASGVDDVWVNGVRALRKGEATGAHSGRAVRGRAWTGAAGGRARGGAGAVLRDGRDSHRGARRSHEPPRHSRARPRHLVRDDGPVWSRSELLAAAAGAIRSRHRRGRGDSSLHLHARRQVSSSAAAHGQHDLCAGCVPRCVARFAGGRRGGRAQRLASGVSGARHSWRAGRAARVAHGARAASRPARCQRRRPAAESAGGALGPHCHATVGDSSAARWLGGDVLELGVDVVDSHLPAALASHDGG